MQVTMGYTDHLQHSNLKTLSGLESQLQDFDGITLRIAWKYVQLYNVSVLIN